MGKTPTRSEPLNFLVKLRVGELVEDLNATVLDSQIYPLSCVGTLRQMKSLLLAWQGMFG